MALIESDRRTTRVRVNAECYGYKAGGDDRLRLWESFSEFFLRVYAHFVFSYRKSMEFNLFQERAFHDM